MTKSSCNTIRSALVYRSDFEKNPLTKVVFTKDSCFACLWLPRTKTKN